MVGGGGYTLRNVARCWCYETGRLMGHDLPDKLPESVLSTFNYYQDNERLRIEVRVPCQCMAGLTLAAGFALLGGSLMLLIARLQTPDCRHDPWLHPMQCSMCIVPDL